MADQVFLPSASRRPLTTTRNYSPPRAGSSSSRRASSRQAARGSSLVATSQAVRYGCPGHRRGSAGRGAMHRYLAPDALDEAASSWRSAARCASMRPRSWKAVGPRRPRCQRRSGHRRPGPGDTDGHAGAGRSEMPVPAAGAWRSMSVGRRWWRCSRSGRDRPRTRRIIAAGKLSALPMRTTVLEDDELVTGMVIPRPSRRGRQRYLKLRLRNAIDFPIGGVAGLPGHGWRVSSGYRSRSARSLGPRRAKEVELLFEGRRLDGATVEEACAIAVKAAITLARHRLKVPVVRALLRQALDASRKQRAGVEP